MQTGKQMAEARSSMLQAVELYQELLVEAPADRELRRELRFGLAGPAWAFRRADSIRRRGEGKEVDRTVELVERG